MKKLVSVLLILFLFVNYLHAQTAESLTNTTIIRMVKANLDDDIIIDDIINSIANFNLSADSLKILSDNKVSHQVIEAMKAANEKQKQSTAHSPQTKVITPADTVKSKKSTVHSLQPSIIAPADTLKFKKTTVQSPQPRVIKPTDTIKSEKSTVHSPQSIVTHIPNSEESILTKKESSTKTEIAKNLSNDNSKSTLNFISYVNPLKELIIFYDYRFASLSNFIQKWDKQIKDLLEKEKRINKIIEKDENELTQKMNTNAKVFSNEILSLKNKLIDERNDYRTLKYEMVKDKNNLLEQLANINKETDQLINDKFDEISKIVFKSQPNPTISDTLNIMTITKQNYDTNLISHIIPLNVILKCYENAIIPLRDTITLWNDKALRLIHQDLKLAKKSEPFITKLKQLEAEPKNILKINKPQRLALNKECKSINEERKQLTKQMIKDSKNLSESLNKIKKEFNSAIKDRINDAIEKITFLFER